jgi:hypothetical protein
MTDLIKRLEEAEAGSRGLDWEIDRLFPSLGTPPAYEWPVELIPAFSRSLDAALALAERVLPGWTRGVDEQNNGRWKAGVFDRASLAHFATEAPTPALALCIAVLKATDTGSEA